MEDQDAIEWLSIIGWISRSVLVLVTTLLGVALYRRRIRLAAFSGMVTAAIAVCVLVSFPFEKANHLVIANVFELNRSLDQTAELLGDVESEGIRLRALLQRLENTETRIVKVEAELLQSRKAALQDALSYVKDRIEDLEKPLILSSASRAELKRLKQRRDELEARLAEALDE